METGKRIIHLLFLTMGLSLAWAQEEAESAFDFWVGEWEVHWYAPDSSVVKGRNHIEKILDGKVLQEHFEAPTSGFKGTSISVYSPADKNWYQSWADNGGGYFHFRGITEDGKRIFTMTEEDARGALYRMVFSDITNRSLTWTWEGTRDGGKSWKTAWQIFYTRL